MPPRKAPVEKPVEEDVTTVAETEEEVIPLTVKPEDDDLPQDLLDQLAEESEDEEEVDPEDPVANIADENRVTVIRMLQGTSYSTPDYEWTDEHPFQLMKPIEAERLMKDLPERFALSNKEQVKDFYKQ